MEGESVAMSTPRILARSSRTAAPNRRSAACRLVAVLDGFGEAVEEGEKVIGGLLGGDRNQFLGELDAAARRASIIECSIISSSADTGSSRST